MSVESVFRFVMYGYTDDPTLEYDRVGLTITSIKGNKFNLYSVDAVLFKEIRAKRLDCFEAKTLYLPEKIRVRKRQMRPRKQSLTEWYCVWKQRAPSCWN